MNRTMRALSSIPCLERDLRLLPHLVRAGQNCVDVGAAWGTYTLPMALLVGQRGTVLSFEPRQAAAQRLARLVQLLRLGQVTVSTTALSSTTGTATLAVPRRWRPVAGRSFLVEGAVHHALDDGLRVGQHQSVETAELDSFRQADRPIHFVKCDVEGAEVDVFVGGATTLTQDRPLVLCEVEERHALRYGRTTDAIDSLFEEYGYERIQRSESTSPAPRNQIYVPAERASDLHRILSALGA